jgi:hypothetical protein
MLLVASRARLKKTGAELPWTIDESALRYKERVRKLAPQQYADDSSRTFSSVNCEQLRRRHNDCLQRTHVGQELSLAITITTPLERLVRIEQRTFNVG